jgi:hypothetical protein
MGAGGSESSPDGLSSWSEDGANDRAHYQDGELVPYKPGAGIDPKPAAANDGTIINVRPGAPLILSCDLFLCHLPPPYPLLSRTEPELQLTNRQKTYSTTCLSVNELSSPLRTNITGFWT